MGLLGVAWFMLVYLVYLRLNQIIKSNLEIKIEAKQPLESLEVEENCKELYTQKKLFPNFMKIMAVKMEDNLTFPGPGLALKMHA